MTAADGIEGLFAALGEAPIEDAVRRFYARVPSDPILGPMYPEDDWEGAEHRLRTFLVYRLGGPATYVEERGHPRLRMRHMPFAIDRTARDRWMELMGAAIAETWAERGLDRTPAGREFGDRLLAFLGDVATFLMNR